jgi:hypothetical protein
LMEIVPPFVPPLVDHTRYFRHAPARLRVDANMFVLACGYAAICPLGRPWFAQGATQARCGVRLAVRLLQRQLYSRLNFKLNRSAALAEWRQ